MESSNRKWKYFWLGVSPALIIFLASKLFREAGPIIFLYSLAYLIVGIALATAWTNSTADKKVVAWPFGAGVVSGFIVSFLLSASLCILGPH